MKNSNRKRLVALGTKILNKNGLDEYSLLDRNLRIELIKNKELFSFYGVIWA